MKTKGKTTTQAKTKEAKTKKLEPLSTLGEFNGKPTISLKRSETDNFGFNFGLGKARLILANIDAIEAFVESDGKSLD